MFSTTISRYSRIGNLKGHKDTRLSALAFAPSGAMLASAAETELRIWNLGAMSTDYSLRSLPSPASGSITCLAWMNGSTIAAGTSKGWISVLTKAEDKTWRQTYTARTSSKQLVCMRSDVAADGVTCLLTGGGEGIVQRWAFSPQNDLSLSMIFSVKVENVAVMALRFGDWRGEEVCVLVFSRDDGRMYALRPDNGDYLAHADLDAPIGAADVSNTGKLLIHCDSGFKVFRHSNVELLHESLILDGATEPIQVAFIENDRCYATGSEHGAVTIFDSDHGDLVDEFSQARDGLVNLISVHECNGEMLIACASSAQSSAPAIGIWKRTRRHRKVKTCKWRFSTLTVVVGSILAAVYCVLVIGPGFTPKPTSTGSMQRERTQLSQDRDKQELTWTGQTSFQGPEEAEIPKEVIAGGERLNMRVMINGTLHDVYLSE